MPPIARKDFTLGIFNVRGLAKEEQKLLVRDVDSYDNDVYCCQETKIEKLDINIDVRQQLERR